VTRVVVLLSGRGSNFQAIAEAQLPIEIAAVISNRPKAAGLDYARSRGIPAVALDHTQHPDREAFDALLADEIERHRPDGCIGGPCASSALRSSRASRTAA
jgi:phosphoribosylglycinamide formyltransferase-1